ncbi:hypothetical protein H696_04534 [Fonticula alba]|uniref:Replication termination factor 2 n=1 Tax=Fonticula alba TaxID=691883 RepID=A0A058Z5A8_FONAL|nr:hypothetical protein H696_04534 [Fonticula alba]KCV69118.1 hypothetical protein H696_04534 [Fonticula alba]|eukprot:XP_009496689.1 hypothetical protein H696_04534 [Fonticula alba]
MGNDGGSFFRRIEMVRVRAEREKLAKPDALHAQWATCFLSSTPLVDLVLADGVTTSIVACPLGRLYSREAVVQFLLRRREVTISEDPTAHRPDMAHIRRLKDLTVLKCPLANSGQYFVCPITGIPLNGTNPIAQARPCGCVAAIRAWANAGVIRREPGDSGLPEPLPESACLVCGQPLSEQLGLVPLYPGPEMEDLVRRRLRDISAIGRGSRGKALRSDRRVSPEPACAPGTGIDTGGLLLPMEGAAGTEGELPSTGSPKDHSALAGAELPRPKSQPGDPGLEHPRDRGSDRTPNGHLERALDHSHDRRPDRSPGPHRQGQRLGRLSQDHAEDRVRGHSPGRRRRRSPGSREASPSRRRDWDRDSLDRHPPRGLRGHHREQDAHGRHDRSPRSPPRRHHPDSSGDGYRRQDRSLDLGQHRARR